jgi:hypothetical protein
MEEKKESLGQGALYIFTFTLIAGLVPGLAGALGEFLVILSDKYFDLSWFARMPILILMGVSWQLFRLYRKKI